MKKKEKLSNILMGDTISIESIENKYPPRNLKEDTMVTRIAPSPTGFMHVGGIYVALISERLAHQTNGIFYLRIEDTDKKRETKGAVDIVIKSLKHFNIRTDEGETTSHKEIGNYGPYKQSKRDEIYKAYIKALLEKGMAYPCFCAPEEIEEIRNQQESLKIRPGYYGKWAKWRNKSENEILDALSNGKKFVIRFKSNGDINNKIRFEDVIKGRKELPENDQDIVIMKSDGLPTYHMAHVIDDHLMGTTHVFRGDEWFISTSLHLQLFNALKWKPPRYGHLAPIQKIEGSSKRKLSKRKDPEASVMYYEDQGYPGNAVIEYLLNLANSNFENWRKANPLKNNQEFKLSLEKLSASAGPLFDINKLNNISKNIISNFSGKEIYEATLSWAKKNNMNFAKKLIKYKKYSEEIFNIERNNADEKTKRKDIVKWADIKNDISFYFDEDFKIGGEEIKTLLSDFSVEDIKTIVKLFIEKYNEFISKDDWLEIIRGIAIQCGYADSNKSFKNNPTKYKGNLADIARIFRVLLTKRIQTPDLYTIMKVMGKARVKERLSIIDTL